ncbi:hypothetical protein [Nocardia transvalensis]|uniref:hypothetical protein n=1 Tax=Nocardia transvalensis TaxID=37333 RepID=UPI001896106D|nr:hypothetical protein [Nocardia transvalensis]MBF6331258.1 hypothetical protein [Nocardia transvalensis]
MGVEAAWSRVVSPRPTEIDLQVCIRTHGLVLTFRACASAAHHFARYWTDQHWPERATVSVLRSECPRLPCERLWLVP